MRVLVVEDNEKLADLLTSRLTEQGYAVDAAASIDAAAAMLEVVSFDLVVLDLTLPDGDGRAFLRALRAAGNGVPVLAATARSDLLERVCTLDDGADDYLVKPFSTEELLARVRALLRRPRVTLDTVLAVGNIALDTASMALSIDGAATEIQRRELSVLAVLLRDQGRLVPRRVLEEAIYSLDDEVTPNALEAAVSRLRRRLEQQGASVRIATMRGLGYILSEQS
ncbi:response regulator [Rhodopila globiformis]|uniref:DNA-binding response regulator n=1 Tax=Rhodopila globiformis TaxID=1071 RepID=A0A2S6NK01_RHOGL|nr:response regulator transcription factor [Rhodopila globiformis]PPQ35276.1 DNA-binding response regulator [Rhodopila globiformis]